MFRNMTSWMALIVSSLIFTLQGATSCVVPVDSGDLWLPPPAAEGAAAPRLRRAVTLRERGHCESEDPQPPGRVDTTDRVSDLIRELKARNLDAYIVPSEDAHQSEYVASADERRRFVSGFRGSAGTAVVLADTGRRALWTDGRYFLEADRQLDCNWLLMKGKLEGVPTTTEWLSEQLSPDAADQPGGSRPRVGVDPALVGAQTFLDIEKKLNDSGVTLVGESTNLVDIVWPTESRPARSHDNVYVLEEQFTGLSWTEKVQQVREAMKDAGADLLVLTAMDEVAWLLNLRGNDVPYNPVFRAYIILDDSKLTLFFDSSRITPTVDFHLHVDQCSNDICFQVGGYDQLVSRLQAEAKRANVRRVLLPKKYGYSGGASYAVYNAVPENKRLLAVSPVLEMKSQKNPVEFKGMKNAHLKDAVALIDFLAFLEKEIEAGNEWTEQSASVKLEEYRAEQQHFKGPSFETISAYGSNGAVIHYRPSPETNKKIGTDSLYLLDSGGQYKDGTTDVTRTLHYGTPTPLQIETYTRVLMGAVDLAALVFPKGTGDASVDILARRYLYEVGLNYLHGTGHGIGMFLSIHESPTQVRIDSDTKHDFKLGQFFSDEPGYYKDDQFGIRLETILAVVAAETKYKSHTDYYAFEPITLVPFEPKLIDTKLLNAQQCQYINTYHTHVRRVVGEELEKQERMSALQYMRQRTEPLKCHLSNSLTAGSAHASSVRASSSPSLGASDGGSTSASSLSPRPLVALLASLLLPLFCAIC